jgi:hypothetical protein
MASNEALYSISLAADASVGMYTGVPGQPGSAVPNSGKQYRFVKVTGKEQCGLATAGTDRVVGVLQNKPQQPGAAATVGIWGVSLVTAGGAVAAGDNVESDAEGRAVKAAAGDGNGVALSASANAGELISVLLTI